MSEPVLERVIFEFTQEGNTDGTTGLPETDGWEELTIEVQSATESLLKGPGYFVLRTRTGWSINDYQELASLINHVDNVFNKK